MRDRGTWKRLLLCFITLSFIVIPFQVYGEEILKIKVQKDAPVEIEADHLEYYKETDTYELQGSVKITQEKAHLESDYATLDNRTGDAIAIGNVWYDDGDTVLISDRIDLNLNTKLGVIYKGSIFHRPDNYHIEGDIIEKHGEDVYEIPRGSFTTCDAVVPAWRFRGKDVEAQTNDHITGYNVVFYIKDLPVLYTPYIRVPIKKERQSGFLFPRPGYGNKKGFILDNAYYWAMADNMDATFYLDYKSKIGIGSGLEYRYILSKDTRGDFYSYYQRDNELKKDYWEYRFNHDQQLPWGIYGRANIIYLSDPTYYQTFSIATEERIQSGLESNVTISKNWLSSRLYLLGQYRQDLTAPSNATTLQKLPELGYFLTNYKVGELPVYLGLESTAINFWRKTGTKGQRLNIYPQVSSILNLGRGFIFSPRMGFRERIYDVEGDILNSSIYDIGANIATKIFRIYDLKGDGGMNKVKHSIEPSIDYTFIPYVNQEKLPQFDGFDLIPKTNLISYALTNRFIGRFGEGKNKRTLEFFTLRLSEGYDITKDQEPFTDFLLEANLRTPELLSLYASTTYSPYRNDITSINSSIFLKGNRPWHISLEERYTKFTSIEVQGNNLIVPSAIVPSTIMPSTIVPSTSKSLFFIAEAGGKVSRSLDFVGRVWYDATLKSLRETDLRGTYSAQCWALTFNYIGRPGENQFLMTLELKGLGSLKLPSFSSRGL